jgi:hypothetical protein
LIWRLDACPALSGELFLSRNDTQLLVEHQSHRDRV